MSDEPNNPSGLIKWSTLFTGLLGTGIIAVVGFLVAAWSVKSDVEKTANEVKTMSQSVAKKSDVEAGDVNTLKDAKSYTDSRLTELVRQADDNERSLSTIAEDIRELKNEQRRVQQDTNTTLKEISKELKRLQIEAARTQ